MAELRKTICAACPNFYCPQGARAATCMGCYSNRPDPWVWSIVRERGRGKTTYSEDFLDYNRYGVSGGKWWVWMPFMGSAGQGSKFKADEACARWACSGGPCGSSVGVLARINFDCD